MNFFSFFRQELAIDLGTANTLIIQNGEVVVDQPSIVAINRKTGLTIAVGTKAMNMHEKTHDDIKTIRPLKDGVIADFQSAEYMIREMIKMISPKIRIRSHPIKKSLLKISLIQKKYLLIKLFKDKMPKLRSL